MDQKERKLLQEMFKKLDKATDGFTKENGILFGTRRLSDFPPKKGDKVIVQMPYKGFKGFSVAPDEFIQKEVEKKYPNANGSVIFFLMEDWLAYVID